MVFYSLLKNSKYQNLDKYTVKGKIGVSLLKKSPCILHDATEYISNAIKFVTLALHIYSIQLYYNMAYATENEIIHTGLG